MSDNLDFPLRLPEPLRQPVSAAWSTFSANAARLGIEIGAFPDTLGDAPDRVWAASPFVVEQCARRPELLKDLLESGHLSNPTDEESYRGNLRSLLEGIDDEAELMAVLRRFRNREMVRIAWRDIAGWAGLAETLQELSALADVCVQESLDFLFRRACAGKGTPVDKQGRPQSLVVLGMGKLGAFELNFSSDIDLIFAYRHDGVLSDKRETSYAEFYTRLARSLVKVLDAVTEDGFVFRVDLRLRPFGDSGPLVQNFHALETYYQSQAREWERYAMIKARPVAGDFEAGRELQEFLRPFVYRRYLDYRTLGELRELKQKISLELQRKDRQENIKLGPGGIREIEFIGQAFQLIRGGREKRLRERRILAVLETLGDLGLLPAPTVEKLREAYSFLRTVENRLQQYADKQTHDLPADPVQRLSLAFAMGFADWDDFKAHIDTVRREVHQVFEQVVTPVKTEEREAFALTGNREQIHMTLRNLGWPNPEAGAKLVETFQGSHAVKNLTPRGASELTRLMPMLLRATASVEQPENTLERIFALLEAIASRNVYLTLLAENPSALSQLVKLAAGSHWIANYIARHPLLLDELLDPRSLYTPLSKAELERELTRKLDSIDHGDLEQILIGLSQFKQSNVLRVAAADFVGAIPIMVVSDYLSYIAEVLINEVMRQAWRLTAARHGVPPGATVDRVDGFGVIAYGKLGGLELGYGSDLDLVFLYQGVDDALTNSERPVGTAEFFARMGRRVIHLLTANTPAGILYEVDLRLRPSGSSGLLVSSVDAYDAYQMDQAWTWEQQALVKARFVAGDPSTAERFGAIREKSLCRKRDKETLRSEIREMREKMRDNLAAKDPAVFDLKQGSGGIVDIEFIVQFGVLSGAHDCKKLTEWTDVVRLLDSLTKAGFLSADDAETLRQAYCLFREHTHRCALLEVPALVPADEHFELRSRVRQIWRDVMER
ncbi:bifunctional [glutamate--ammonia ligase]-adenylyl-L-tyrosine phosphorylase/[glutamate--ammonia-ligase] adenylyltransferase [Methylocaldum sp. MU1018]